MDGFDFSSLFSSLGSDAGGSVGGAFSDVGASSFDPLTDTSGIGAGAGLGGGGGTFASQNPFNFGNDFGAGTPISNSAQSAANSAAASNTGGLGNILGKSLGQSGQSAQKQSQAFQPRPMTSEFPVPGHMYMRKHETPDPTPSKTVQSEDPRSIWMRWYSDMQQFSYKGR